MNQLKKSFLLSILLFNFISIQAQDGINISVKVEGYNNSEAYLAYYYADKMYVRDTVQKNDQGVLEFRTDEVIPGGIYLVVFPPDNNYFQILLKEGNESFSMSTTYPDLIPNMRVDGNEDNALFYEYLRFIGQQSPLAQELKKQYAEASEEEKPAIERKQDEIDALVKDYQTNLINQHPNTFAATVVGANMPFDVPEFEGETEEMKQRAQLDWIRAHYFDNINLADPNMIRTPFFFEKVKYYLKTFYAQHPDSISLALTKILDAMEPAEENFQFFLVHYLNEYAKSNIVGMDAVYVHLVDTYYASGRAPWTDGDQLEKIIENANGLKPTLIGKIAPDIRLERKDGTTFNLHDIPSKYTILYFWRFDCGHCQESTPVVKEFYQKFKDKGVTLVAVCTKFTDDIKGCWDYVEENEIEDWMHGVDTYHRSKYMELYYIKSTPQIFILDQDKKIIIKKIGSEQLEDVMTSLMENETLDK
jgi:thiol-disulfide isomerase/thioredoxin